MLDRIEVWYFLFSLVVVERLLATESENTFSKAVLVWEPDFKVFGSYGFVYRYRDKPSVFALLLLIQIRIGILY